MKMVTLRGPYEHQEWGIGIIEREPSELSYPQYELNRRTGILYITPPRPAKDDDSKLTAKVAV
jgi:hypothetical protein